MEDIEQIKLKRKTNKLRKALSFILNNWIIILIILMFASQVYVVLQIRKLISPAIANRQENSFGNDMNQMKSMMSSLFSRIGTMQGDINYIKSRR